MPEGYRLRPEFQAVPCPEKLPHDDHSHPGGWCLGVWLIRPCPFTIAAGDPHGGHPWLDHGEVPWCMGTFATEPRQVRINGLPYQVPGNELLDPCPTHDHDLCGANEPADWGGSTCDLAPHGPEVMHISHWAEGHVLAMWADYLAADPAERVMGADVGGELWGRHLASQMDGQPPG